MWIYINVGPVVLSRQLFWAKTGRTRRHTKEQRQHGSREERLHDQRAGVLQGIEVRAELLRRDMHMFDEVGQVLFLPDSHLRPRVHVLVRVWSRRLPKHVGMLRALHQTITRLLSLQSILAQHIRKAANSSYRNN